MVLVVSDPFRDEDDRAQVRERDSRGGVSERSVGPRPELTSSSRIERLGPPGGGDRLFDAAVAKLREVAVRRARPDERLATEELIDKVGRGRKVCEPCVRADLRAGGGVGDRRKVLLLVKDAEGRYVAKAAQEGGEIAADGLQTREGRDGDLHASRTRCFDQLGCLPDIRGDPCTSRVGMEGVRTMGSVT